MSGVSTPGLASLFWVMLIAGAALAGFGLLRSIVRWRDWKCADRYDDSEVVFGDIELEVGQSASIAPSERTLAGDSPGDISATITALSRKQCVLLLERETDLVDSYAESCGARPLIGETVIVSVTGKTALYRFTSRVRDIRVIYKPDGGVDHSLVVSRPIWLSRVQRRQHARVDLKLPVTFERVWSQFSEGSSPTSTQPLQTGTPMHGSVHNLSGGGLRAQIGGILGLQELDHLLKLFAPETTVRLRLPWSALPENALLARVRTCERAASRGGLTLQVTCEFLPMPAWEQELVISYVFRLQRERLKKGEMQRYDRQSSVYQ
jgi:c-di-GMP-binding flagellar brake protein YcgR